MPSSGQRLRAVRAPSNPLGTRPIRIVRAAPALWLPVQIVAGDFARLAGVLCGGASGRTFPRERRCAACGM